MKYLLVVGFTCDVYRREPRARIFVGDKLIDEFLIQHHIDTCATAIKNFWSNRQIFQPLSVYEFVNLEIKHFPPLLFYEVEIGTTLDQVELRIEIENSDSNNTNGFITASTLIQLQVCNFFPLHEKLLLRLKKIRDKNHISENYAWYCVKKNCIFNLVRNGLCWRGKNGQIFYTEKGQLGSCQIGGDGAYLCQLTKKYGIFMPALARACRYNFNYITTNYFFDKYQQHAHQRNND